MTNGVTNVVRYGSNNYISRQPDDIRIIVDFDSTDATIEYTKNDPKPDDIAKIFIKKQHRATQVTPVYVQ